MKAYVILISIVLALTLALGVTFVSLQKMKQDRDRLENNFDQYMYETDQVITLTKRELKNYLSENEHLDSLLKAERLKPARVEWITEVKYKYLKADTVWVEVGDWSQDSTYFPISYNDGCLAFQGGVDIIVPSVRLDLIEYNDKQTFIGYLKKRDTGRRFLWIFPIRKQFLELHADSECGDVEVHHINILK